MTARKRKLEKHWKYRIGRVSASERGDRGGAIWARVRNKITGKYDRTPLYGPIRDASGEIVPALENAARAAAVERDRHLAANEEPVLPGAKLTLKRAVRMVLDPKHGKYVGSNDWQGDVKRHLERAVEILGDIPVESIKHAHYRALWRRMAEMHVQDSTRNGVRATEMVCGSLRTAMSWLAQEEHVEPNTALPAKGWKGQLHAEWEKITGKPIAPPKKLRYTKEEAARLWKHLPQADARIRLATEIGAELRLGQVVERTRRSDVAPHGGHEIGKVQVHGAGKKFGELVILTDDQRAAIVEAVTTGYLADLEEAYQSRKIDDYILITGGYLAGGRAQVKNAMKALSKRVVRKFWRELEAKARVPHIDGRGWYGLRRRGADDAEDVESDARVLNRMGGWKNSQTRSRYQEEGRTELSEKAANVRGKIRPKRSTESAELTPSFDTTETPEK